jgi:hypothetical protein
MLILCTQNQHFKVSGVAGSDAGRKKNLVKKYGKNTSRMNEKMRQGASFLCMFLGRAVGTTFASILAPF